MQLEKYLHLQIACKGSKKYLFNQKKFKIMGKIKEIKVSYKGYKNLTKTFKSINKAIEYCNNIYNTFGIDMMLKETFIVTRYEKPF